MTDPRKIPHHIIKDAPPATAAVLAAITDKFVEGENGALHMLNCPVEEHSFYDIFQNENGSYLITVDDELDVNDPTMDDLPNLDAAKEQVAIRIARKIEAACTTLSRARDYGIALGEAA